MIQIFREEIKGVYIKNKEKLFFKAILRYVYCVKNETKQKFTVLLK